MAMMFSKSHKQEIHVVRVSDPPPHLVAIYARAYRTLRLQALRESPLAFLEKHDEASARPPAYWQHVIKRPGFLIQIAVAEPNVVNPYINDKEATDPIARGGTLLAMVVIRGPIPAAQFLCPPNSGMWPHRPEGQEICFHGAQLYIIPEFRGRQKGLLFEAMLVDQDLWLLDIINQAKLKTSSSVTPDARLRAGVLQPSLLRGYTRYGWHLAGSETKRSCILANSGPEGVREAEKRGEALEDMQLVVERILTVAHLEWRIAENRRLLQAAKDGSGIPGRQRLSLFQALMLWWGEP
jgi:hypothetical protein